MERSHSRSVLESSEGLEEEGSNTIKTTTTKNDLVLLGDGEKQETFGGHTRPDDYRDVLPTWRSLAVDARGSDQCMVWQAIHHCSSTPFNEEQKSTNPLRSHRLGSRGAYLWETPSRGRFAALSDGGRLFLNLFWDGRVGPAAQRLGVRAAFWNLRYERYDVALAQRHCKW